MFVDLTEFGLHQPGELAIESGEHYIQRKQRHQFGDDCGRVESRVFFGDGLLGFDFGQILLF